MRGEGTKIALYNIFAKIDADMEMLKGDTSKDNIIATDGCEYSSVMFIESDVRFNFRKAEVMDGYLLIGFELFRHYNAGDRFGYRGNDV